MVMPYSTKEHLYTPRGGRKFRPWPVGSGKTRRERRLSFTPAITHYNGPAPSPSDRSASFRHGSGERKDKKVSTYSVDDLRSVAEQRREQAAATSSEKRQPSIQVLLGRVVEEKEGDARRDSTKGIDSMLKAWDPKGKGEVAKVQMVSKAPRGPLIITSSVSRSATAVLCEPF